MYREKPRRRRRLPWHRQWSVTAETAEVALWELANWDDGRPVVCFKSCNLYYSFPKQVFGGRQIPFPLTIYYLYFLVQFVITNSLFKKERKRVEHIKIVSEYTHYWRSWWLKRRRALIRLLKLKDYNKVINKASTVEHQNSQ